MLRVLLPILLALLSPIVPWASAQDAWLNTRSDVQYVGNDQCIECHQDQYASYLKTTHSVATTKTDPDQEPPPAQYTHQRSGSKYEVTRQGDQLVHRETRLDLRGDPLAVTEHPMAYTVGSGAHGKSYVFRSGQFWGQSPLTWYRETGSWEISPGFNRYDHSSFQRPITTRCVFCHVGNIDRGQHNPFQFEIIETAISCERCHGPGQLHVNKHRNDADATGRDLTIVNPASMSRELGEAVCQQCHLQGVSKVNTTGKQPWDYRPGLPLTDFRIDFQFGLGNDRMRIVGHVEQLHASDCYRQTETLTCTTCHDPHNPVPIPQRTDFYRETCLGCHEDQSCAKPHQERMQLAENSCYECHMPKAETNVTHAAFHHHRIGVHSNGSEQEVTTKLIPVLDVSGLPQRERIRCEALAKVILYQQNPDKPESQDYATEAIEALIGLKQSGPTDAFSDSKLAWLARAQGMRDICEDLAGEALEKERRPTMARIEATSLLAYIAFQKNQKQRAVELYRTVAGYHRDARDTLYLGMCENNIGNVPAAIDALEKAIQIDPMQVGPRTALQAIYEATGQPDKAAEQVKTKERITQTLQMLRAGRGSAPGGKPDGS